MARLQAMALLAAASCSPPAKPPPPPSPAPTPPVVPSLVVAPLASASAAPSPLDDLGWMLGHWRVVEGDTVHEEVWFRFSPEVWLGFNRATTNGRLRSHELLRLDGTASPIRYLAAPIDQTVTPFALAEQADQEARFTHPSHDPGWVHYVRDGERMTASIGEGGSDETYATWRFRYVGEGATREEEIHLCRIDGRDAVRVILPPAGAGVGECRAHLLCRAFEIPGGADLHLAYLTSGSCDDREEVIGTCDVPRGDLSIHGTSPRLDDRCTEVHVPVLHLTDP